MPMPSHPMKATSAAILVTVGADFFLRSLKILDKFEPGGVEG
jgi:hypothetical protein